MNIVVTEEKPDLQAFARLGMALRVTSVFDAVPVERGLGGIRLVERAVATPYVKDYDAAGSPLEWADRFDLTPWGFLMARSGEALVGAAAVVSHAPELEMLEVRADLAVLWDIRVAAMARGQGVGSALFAAVEKWARAKGCARLKVETQNINVPACRFYAKHGCVLGAIVPFAYAAFPDEVELLWYKDLG